MNIPTHIAAKPAKVRMVAIDWLDGLRLMTFAIMKPSIDSGASCACMALTTSGIATAFARGNCSRSGARPKKWSPCP